MTECKSCKSEQVDFFFSSINLGCNKNLVDTQYLLWKLLSFQKYNKFYNIQYFTEALDESVEFVFLNTCWFLSTGRKETVSMIKELLEHNKKIYLVGCVPNYFKNIDNVSKEAKEFLELISHPNIFQLSWKDFDKISILQLSQGYDSRKFDWFSFPDSPRAYTNIDYKFEYIKIAEWCNNSCSFCIIPKIRGKQKSMKLEVILEEIRNLLKSGVEEIIILAQDTTRYWIDLYEKPYLFELLEEIEKIEGNFVYRLLYLYPDILTLKQLEKLKGFKKFLPYFDIPLQHISAPILKNMGRFYNTESIYKFLDFIYNNFPTRFVRTNLIVWFPWETKDDINQLIEFVEKSDIDNIAIFEYHDEKFAPSSKLDWKLSDEEVHNHFLQVKKIVDKKLDEKSQWRKWKEYIGYIMDIRGEWDNMNFVVRPILHAPEIDEYDILTLSQITGVCNENGELDIWEKIIYNI